MDHPLQHPWVIISTIVSIMGLGALGMAAYADIKSDIAVTQANIKANSALDEQRYDALNIHIKEIKKGTEHIIDVLDMIRYGTPHTLRKRLQEEES